MFYRPYGRPRPRFPFWALLLFLRGLQVHRWRRWYHRNHWRHWNRWGGPGGWGGYGGGWGW